MKSLIEINQLLESFDDKYKTSVTKARQGSPEWLNLKLGVLSASRASEIVAGKKTATRSNYMAELLAQICTGEGEEINSKYLEWGNFYEGAARASYEFSTDTKIEQVLFVFKDGSFREGCSPDGIVNGKGVEIKCPYNAANYIKFLVDDKIKPEYEWQYQYAMRVMGCDEFDFVQYHPNMNTKPIKILTVKKDLEKQKAFDDLVPEFIQDMDAMLKSIGVEFGSQWGVK